MSHAVIVHLPLSDTGFGTAQDRRAIYALEDRLTGALEQSGVGEFDGEVEFDLAGILGGRRGREKERGRSEEKRRKNQFHGLRHLVILRAAFPPI